MSTSARVGKLPPLSPPRIDGSVPHSKLNLKTLCWRSVNNHTHGGSYREMNNRKTLCSQNIRRVVAWPSGAERPQIKDSKVTPFP